MNYSDNHFVIAIGPDANERPEDERALEEKYLVDRDEEAQEPAVVDEDEFGDEHFVTHKGRRHSARQKVIWDNLTDDDPE